ncbi:MAG: PPK2 family polyphosphate:nucleotide phosphotransferase [Myxococcota bacterium]|jgi:PPK2 family polyphosphate:nucleotide phosphotransferase
MFRAPESPWRVPFDGSFSIDDSPTEPPPKSPGKKALNRRLDELRGELADLQRMLYAQDQWSVLLVFQAMDAAGKDGTIRAVLRGVNPAGCEVSAFKQPSARELDHDFLWRTAKRLPQRGRIGVFNRSYYEEVLVVRVHPEYLGGQKLPHRPPLDRMWAERAESIADHEKHLARNGTAVLKFWLNVSRDEQRRRFLARIDEPDKNWKFSEGDLAEAQHWDAYMAAYEDALNRTSRDHAPWYAIPADDKRFMRVAVAEVVVSALKSLGLGYPAVDDARRAELQAMRGQLTRE